MDVRARCEIDRAIVTLAVVVVEGVGVENKVGIVGE